MEKKKLNFWNIFLASCLVAIFLIQFSADIYAGSLTKLKDRLSRLIQNQTSGITHVVVFITENSVSGGAGNNSVVLIFPDTDDGNWCATVGTDLVVTGSTEDSATELPGTLTARCVKGVGVLNYDTIFIEGVDNLSADTKYAVQISDGTIAKLGTPSATTSGIITLKTNNGTSNVDSEILVVDIVTNDQVVVTASVGDSSPSSSPPLSGGYVMPVTRVIFSGYAYPGAFVTLLKDAQIVGTTIADNNANFGIALTGLSPGTYNFSLYAKDQIGISSRLLIFSLRVEPNIITTISNILIPPTIMVDKREVVKGETVTMSGWSAPNAYITIFIKDFQKEFLVKTISDFKGKYQYILNTTSLPFGNVKTSVRVSFDGIVFSELSKMVNFLVGTKTVFEKPPVRPIKGDLNDDCSVDIIDFSILIFWFNRPSPPAKVDLDGNGVADIIDFSIMAFYWTG